MLKIIILIKKTKEYYSKILKIIDSLKENNNNEILITTEIEIKKY